MPAAVIANTFVVDAVKTWEIAKDMKDQAAARLHTHEAAGEFEVETAPFALDPTAGRGEAIPKHWVPRLPFTSLGTPSFGQFGTIQPHDFVVVFGHALPKPWQQWDIARRPIYAGNSFSKGEKLLTVVDP